MQKLNAKFSEGGHTVFLK